ncbi:glycosyltransferase family 29 protein [Microbacterium suaedae]|uniref:glycosyltransferase family 29 protein n=1 Tax=Microbacterium suaedae TaxID=2067813 RepID=UPI0013A66822|nr:glycosyltransferase family 29 protein [Microbacterium suaedae]
MNPLDSFKKLPGARAVLREVKKTEIGRRAVSQTANAIRSMGARRDAYGVDLADVLPSRHQDFQILRCAWRDDGPTQSILTQARELATNDRAWSALHPAAWLVYAAASLEASEVRTAETISRRYADEFGPDRIAEVLPLAPFVHNLGVRTPELDSAAATAEVLFTADPRERFRDLVAGKTVAVVGNGPGNLSTGLGAEVDAHDVVIRFNNFPSGHERDYGARTDVWVRGAHRDVRDRHNLHDFSLVLWEMDLRRNLLEHPSHLEILARDALFAPEKLAWIDTETKRTLRDTSGLRLPTSGAQVLWLLAQARDGDLSGVDVYGFSSVDGGADHGHYYDTLGDMGTRHEVEREGSFLRGLLGRDEPVNTDETIIFNCAYRDYDPARGRTGGPAGVLATQRLALGEEHAGHEMRFLFDKGDKGALKHSLPHLTAGLSGKPVDLILGAEYVRTHPEVTNAIDAGRRVVMVCHDLGSALGANQLGVPYVIVYHQQGSTLQEMRSIGRTPTAHETAVVTRLEEVICAGAERMYFPSDGARAAFESTADPALAAQIRFGDEPLYNTLSAVDHSASAAPAERLPALARKLDLPVKDDDLDVFISVGDWNGDKGLDRVPALLEVYREQSGRRVLWIAIGSAIDRTRFAEAQEASQTWSFESRLIGKRMTHADLLALVDYADVYVMMHRHSIFDLAILEAMRAGKGVVLSPAGGNPEFDIDGNVEFVTDDNLADAARAIIERDWGTWGESNRRAFAESFSLGHFADRYRDMLDEVLASGDTTQENS